MVVTGPKQVHDGMTHRGGQRVSAERAAVLTGLEHPQHLPISHDSRDRHNAPTERLSEQVDIGDHILVLARQRSAGPAKTGLDFVGDQQDIALPRQLAEAA